MIVCRIEMWPRDGGKIRPLGEIRITNIGGTRERGDYKVELFKSAEYARQPGIWRRAVVQGFERLRLGPYDLLLRGLVACIAGRNQAVATAGRRGELGEQEPVDAIEGVDLPPPAPKLPPLESGLQKLGDAVDKFIALYIAQGERADSRKLCKPWGLSFEEKDALGQHLAHRIEAARLLANYRGNGVAASAPREDA